MTEKISIEEMTTFCKKKGLVYPSGEIYGGVAGFFDFGPLGVEIKNNIKQHWWKTFVQQRQDIVGLDGSIITHPQVWRASGHVDCFADFVLKCSNIDKCGLEVRADHFIEDALKVSVSGKAADINWSEMNAAQINKIIASNKLKCPQCKSDFKEVENFNLMFQTQIGPKKDGKNVAYLRPETAQLIFTNFKLIHEHARMNLPFGIAQIRKAFRNEISPRDFLFRSREFEQMEIEYFVQPDHINDCPFIEQYLEYNMQVLTSEAQNKKGTHTTMTIQQMLDQKLTSTWHCYWLVQIHQWFVQLGVQAENLRVREHMKSELAHYAGACFDFEYQFPFGWKEIHGSADRTQFDLSQHLKVSGKEMSIYDEETKGKIIPYVAAEPSQGVERALLVFLYDAYEYDKERGNVVLRLHPSLAPIKVGVFPLVNKINEKAKEVYEKIKNNFYAMYDKSGSIGRRYARADEIGIPYCVTLDFESLQDEDCTIRDRNTTKQIRVKIVDLKEILQKLLHGEMAFEKAGKIIPTK